jgi:nascent polypeptide-associated complex subunit beta
MDASKDAKQKQIMEARAKLAEKYANVRIGGEGSARRKFKATHKTAMNDTKLDAVMKKFNTQPIPDIAEVNLFTKDLKVISFQRPTVHASFQTQTMIVSGTSVTRDLKSCFTEVMPQLSAKQLEAIKSFGPAAGEKKEDKKEDKKDQPKPDFLKASEEKK